MNTESEDFIVHLYNYIVRYYSNGYLDVKPSINDVNNNVDYWMGIYRKLLSIGKYVYIVEGKLYFHINDIIEVYKLSKPTIHHRINSGKFPEWAKHDPKEDGKIRKCSGCGGRVPKNHRMLCMRCYKTDDNSFYEDPYDVHLPS